MQTRIEGHEGWVEVTRDGVSVLAKGDETLVERITAALDAADGDDLADVVVDELSAGGVRRTPDFALVDHASGRVLVRGSAVVRHTAADGSSREVTAPTRGPWADEDVDTDGEVTLVTGEAAAEPVAAVAGVETDNPETDAAERVADSGAPAPVVVPAPEAAAQQAPVADERTDAAETDAEPADEPVGIEPAEAEQQIDGEQVDEPSPETPVDDAPFAPDEAPQAPAESDETPDPEAAVETPGAPNEAPAASATPASTGQPADQPAGWAMPSVFGGGQPSDGSSDRPSEQQRPQLSVVPDPVAAAQQREQGEEPTPVDEGAVIETPAPEGRSIGAGEATPVADLTDEPAADAAPAAGMPDGAAQGATTPAAVGGASGDDEELPSFDFLFGTTHSHRSSLLAGMEEDEAQAEAIDSGPVAAAGGFQPQDNPANATLAPPSEDEEIDRPAGPRGPTIGALPGGLPPMPGSAPAREDSPAGAPGQEDSPADAAGGAPAGDPGHFVSGAVTGGSPEQGPAATPAAASPDSSAEPARPDDAEPARSEERPAVFGAMTGREPGPAPSTPPSAPSFGVQSARDDAPGHEPGGNVRPLFRDGHLVGSRVPQAGGSADEASTAQPVGGAPAPHGAAAAAAPAPAAGGAAGASSAPAAGPADHAAGGEPPSSSGEGVISSVPWGDGGTGSMPGGVPAMPGLPGSMPGLPTPDLGPAQPAQQVAPAVDADTGDIPTGPMVLAVRCSRGHHNAPHATRCRVCGQDLPSQQPEQTPRPALGQLRLSTGDVVTLDRGVLIGRAPRAAAEASGARAPHLVRISSPDNEISRNHVEIVLDGWHVLVRDLGSTNGTTVALPGSSPVRVRPGDQQTIEPGTTITLADQVSMVFEVTG